MSDASREEILAKLEDIFRSVFADDRIVLTEGTTAADVTGWDSLQQIKIILACEKKLGIRLRARDINALENVGEMITHLQTALAKTSRKQ
jgi:acyl carrier protein